MRTGGFPEVYALAALLAFAAACGPAGEHASEGKTGSATAAKPTATPLVNERGEKLETFDAELLQTARRTRQWVVDMPIVTQLLDEKRARVAAQVEMAVECADEATFKELTERSKDLTGPIADALSTKDLEYVRSVRGKLKIKEEIVYRYRNSPLLEHKMVRDVYFKRFVVVFVR